MMRRWLNKIVRTAPKVARLLLFVGVVYGVAMAWALRSAQAEVQEIMLGLGAEMMHHPGAQQGDLQTLRMNGASINVRTGHIGEPVEDVLDFFEQRCQEHDGQIAAQLREMIDQAPELADIDPDAVDGTMRFETSHRGYVGCLDTGGEREDHESLMGRLQRFADTGNVSEVGFLRYLYAERLGDEETFFVTIFSDTDLNLFEMFPTEGDAPGRDPEGIPRPPDSRRILSAFIDDAPYAMTLYTTTKHSVREVIGHYRQALPTEGWSPVEAHEGETVTIDGVTSLTFTHGERLTTVNIARDDEQGQTTATVLTSDREP